MAYRTRNLVLLFSYLIPLTGGIKGEEAEPTLNEFRFYVASSSRIRNVRFAHYDESGHITRTSPTGFRTSGRSIAYDYHGPNTVTFFEEHPAPTKENPEAVIREPVARTTVPSSVREVMFLFNKAPQETESQLKYDLQWIDLGEAKIPEGHITIFNTLPITLKGAVGNNPNGKKGVAVTVVPGINPPLDVQPSATVLLALESKSEEIIRIYEDTIYCRPNERVLLVIFPPRFPGSHNVGSKIISFHSDPSREPTATPEPEDKE